MARHNCGTFLDRNAVRELHTALMGAIAPCRSHNREHRLATMRISKQLLMGLLGRISLPTTVTTIVISCVYLLIGPSHSSRDERLPC
uniref:Uncharacterized protein n=1 Tax=Candidatus Kentrum eta TaxID=2126337 RepID=A0A450V9N1_9GAMM|nr:MAG: hypothetical protein BECKH772B_GA0070898_102353 [Candidatus Kentron sp. H]VFK05009.1 MAG: hypothetical protein BECKH772C_GA0070978_102293 [Candidatus Kentron sp. H]